MYLYGADIVYILYFSGFGMTTPRTVAGKIVLIFYGFFGCAGTILFFNLFLERIITFLAYILRSIHERELKRKGLLEGPRGRRGSQNSDDDRLDTWKPSVYWVMLILFLGAVIVACIASAMYHPVEDWTYFERSEEHTSETPVTPISRMPSSA